jgi:hypothetical protein
MIATKDLSSFILLCCTSESCFCHIFTMFHHFFCQRFLLFNFNTLHNHHHTFILFSLNALHVTFMHLTIVASSLFLYIHQAFASSINDNNQQWRIQIQIHMCIRECERKGKRQMNCKSLLVQHKLES